MLIAGKGHEDYQILGGTKIHFDDREIARDQLVRRVEDKQTRNGLASKTEILRGHRRQDRPRRSERTRFGEMVTDSTKVKRGAVFLALKGERQMVIGSSRDAVKRGAECALSFVTDLHRSAYGAARQC